VRINYSMLGIGLTGGVRVLLEVGNELVARGHDVTFSSTGRPNDLSWIDLKAKTRWPENPNLVRLFERLDRYAGTRSAPMRELQMLARETPDCDVNVATDCMTTYAVRWSGKGVPVIHMQHHDVVMHPEGSMTRRMAEDTFRLPMNRIANSIWLARVLRETYGIDGIPVINPALDHAVFHPREAKETKAKPRVVCFSRNLAWKGFADATAAMRLVKKARDVEFVAYGRQAPQDPHGVVDRWVRDPSDDELAALYSSADVVLCPSWYESFPLPPIEAMACGAPVVTTRDGTEDYAFDGKNSLVVPPRDVETMAAAVERLLADADLRERFRREGIATAKGFTWKRTADQVETYFKGLLRQAPA
jgi:glycosyltransferase involved in cell wall biosynthesis